MAKPKKQQHRPGSKPGTKAHEPALKLQYNRTGFLNSIAGELNNIVDNYSRRATAFNPRSSGFKSRDFYQRLLRLFRQEPSDKRFLLLNQLVGMEINPAYPSNRSNVVIKTEEKEENIVVHLHTVRHPRNGKISFNCYYHEVILITWNNSDKPAYHSSLLTEWVYLDTEHPDFEFIFPKPAGTTHWLVCLRRRLGVDEVDGGTFAEQSMYIADAGTFDKEEEELLNKLKKEREKKVEVRKKADDVVRVKAKKKE